MLTVASGQILDLDGAGNVTDIITTADIILESSSILKGSASVGDITVQAGGILAPGNSPGTITASSLTLGVGGVMNFEVAAVVDLSGVDDVIAGTDYDTIAVTGILNLSALSFESRFNLNLLSVGEGPFGSANGWDSNSPISLVLFSYDTVTGLGGNDNITSLFTAHLPQSSPDKWTTNMSVTVRATAF